MESIKKTPYIFLFFVLGSFTLSALNDKIKLPGLHPYLYEDSFKMIGIICRLTYHYIVCLKVLRNTIR
ncbi:hypothetical protein [Anseongella ginsenosidimutans]|uniref:hypothetical protein n=1 Tax=Anseongella ginsenosidimutans TaxID=496056 RepID=UPI00104868B4|nr:hypothetical protein [Anseongella ginsenosidimutans]QEC53068.1 hypothetical protein FRZ59_12465 [Anseongella ginsenosidimutans]